MSSSSGAVRALVAAAALAGVAMLAAACGTSTPPASPASTTSATASPTTGPTTPAGSPTPTATATQAGPPPCATSALRVSVPTGNGNAAAGSSYYPIQFVNTSSSPCTLYGYPGVSFATASGGSQIGIPATRNPTFPATLITVSPGQTVHAELQVVDAMNYPSGDCGLITAHWLKVYPPNQTAPVYVSFSAQTCSKPKTVLSVQTVQTGSSGA